jgi:hypothetical protein
MTVKAFVCLFVCSFEMRTSSAESSTATSIWAVTQRQPNPDKPLFFGSVRVFTDKAKATEHAWAEDGDGEMDLPLHELELEGAQAAGGVLRDIWICGVWYEEDGECIGLLPRAFRSLEDAKEATSGRFCEPSDIGLSTTDCEKLREEGMIDPDHLELEIVRVSAAGQPNGEFSGSAIDKFEDESYRDEL